MDIQPILQRVPGFANRDDLTITELSCAVFQERDIIHMAVESSSTNRLKAFLGMP